MKDTFKLAWSNIWRNKRRTLITIASVFFAMLISLVMRSLQVGSYGHMADGIVKAFSGFIQIHKDGYHDDPTVENTFAMNGNMVAAIESLENVETVIPRFESFALASTGEQTKGILVVGIDPLKEVGLINPRNKIKQGVYFDDQPGGVLVSRRLSEFLRIKVNDTLTMISQGYHGATAAGIYPVAGIIEMPNPSLDRQIVFMPLELAQDFYGAENMLTSLVINVLDSDELVALKKQLIKMYGDKDYEIMDWKELNPELVQQIQSDQAGGYIMLAILYLIVGFGVLGTLIMMTTERRREFGVMVAVGMQKKRLGLLLTAEMLLMGLVGAATGILGSLPIIAHFVRNPIKFTGESAELFEQYGFEAIMPARLEGYYFTGQTVVVLIIFTLAIIYPVVSVLRLKEFKALRS